MKYQIDTPVPLTEALQKIIVPALMGLPQKFQTAEAQLMLLAIGEQESGFRTRQQEWGPAKGFWQFEINGVRAVFGISTITLVLGMLCKNRSVGFHAWDVFCEIPLDDILAASIARFLLYSDPKSLPAIGNEEAAWEYYVRNWSPGKPNRERWVNSYGEALKEFST